MRGKTEQRLACEVPLAFRIAGKDQVVLRSLGQPDQSNWRQGHLSNEIREIQTRKLFE